MLAQVSLRRPSGNFPGLAEEAIEAVIAKHAKPWKEQTLIDHTEAAVLMASAYFHSIEEWARIRSALSSSPLINSVQVRSLSRNGADILIRAFGTPEKLAIAMKAQGIILWADEIGDVWRIATPSTAQQMRVEEGTHRFSPFWLL